jgi:hypothetical protein
MREDVKTTDTPLAELDQDLLEHPAAFMMMTKFSGVLVRKVSPQRQRAPGLSSPDAPLSPGKFPGGAVCVAIGVEFLIRNDAVGPQGPLLSFCQEPSLQFLVTEVCSILIQDLPLGKRSV